LSAALLRNYARGEWLAADGVDFYTRKKVVTSRW
jgi:hypothetical protein